MENSEIKFPLYRKYVNNLAFFKVLSFQEFIEYRSIGSKYSIHQLKASILPDRNYIIDLIENQEKNYLEISEKEYLQLIKSWKEEKTLIAD